MQRVVPRLPLAELWDDAGPVPAPAARDLAAEDIRELLRAGPVRLVDANVGRPLRGGSAAEPVAEAVAPGAENAWSRRATGVQLSSWFGSRRAGRVVR